MYLSQDTYPIRYIESSEYFCIAFQDRSLDVVEISSKISYASNVSVTFFCVDKCDAAVHIRSEGCYRDDDVAHLITHYSCFWLLLVLAHVP